MRIAGEEFGAWDGYLKEKVEQLQEVSSFVMRRSIRLMRSRSREFTRALLLLKKEIRKDLR